MKKQTTTGVFGRILQRPEVHRIKNHPLAIPVIASLLLVGGVLAGYILLNGRTVRPSDSHTVILSYDEQRETLPTRAKNVKEFLDRAGVAVEEGDVVEPSLDAEILDDNFRVNVYRARPVIIIDGGTKISALSAATTPRSVATQAGVTVYPEDKIEMDMPDNILEEGALGERVTIDRATPAMMNIYGTQVSVRTHAQNVGELLKEKNVVLGPDDSVQPGPEAQLLADTQVFVTRSGVQLITVEEEIPMQTQIIEDASLSFGASAVRQQGSPGRKTVTYEVESVNSVETSRKIIQEVTIQQPVTHIVARGKAVYIPSDKESIMRSAGIASSDFAYVNYIISRESGWNAFARNTRSGAYGLCQALPGTKMASAGADWETNPVTQLRWCSGYAVGRYGSWSAAYNFWLANHWW